MMKAAIKVVSQTTPDQSRGVFEVGGKVIPLGEIIGSRITARVSRCFSSTRSILTSQCISPSVVDPSVFGDETQGSDGLSA